MGLILFSLAAIVSLFPRMQPSEGVTRSFPADSTVTFTTAIAPLLKANCTPCHFPGGTVYEKYPFESYETAFALRKKLATRLKEPDQQMLLERWLQNGTKK